ncbi:hypothetical protein JTE90_005524 [Oedothorax gibbosus]|uniref:Gustatory receptor n=1 Tax=Oedothorax gibbosus TaxID=931172 RepID=A0AAV6VBZ4_9ARAC|nr:hypothetical protein JTE90_005524 [Oedothorax gibbosus]
MDSFRKVIYTPPLVPDKFKELYLNFIILSIIISYSSSVSVCGITFIFCRNLYIVLGRMVHKFGRTLQSRLNHRMPIGSRLITEDMTTFRDITFVTHEVDDSFNMCVFLMYVFVMCGYFNTVSVMFTNDPMMRTPASLAYVTWVFAISTFILLELSCRGSFITDRVEVLKRIMIGYSNKMVISASSGGNQPLESFNFLFEIVMKSNVAVTGGGMFIINYGLILAVAGTLVTYSVLILQLDQDKSQ